MSFFLILRNSFLPEHLFETNARNCSTNEHNITHYGKNYAYYGNSFLFLPSANTNVHEWHTNYPWIIIIWNITWVITCVLHVASQTRIHSCGLKRIAVMRVIAPRMNIILPITGKIMRITVIRFFFCLRLNTNFHELHMNYSWNIIIWNITWVITCVLHVALQTRIHSCGLKRMRVMRVISPQMNIILCPLRDKLCVLR